MITRLRGIQLASPMRKAVSLCVFPGLLLFVAAHFAQMHPGYARDESANQSKERYGTVEGQVITREGLPVPDATVYAFKLGGSPLASTNTKGKFTLPAPVGKHRISAYKESESYPDPLWSFYSEAYGRNESPIVNVQENQIVQGVIVRLGPKARRLFIRVIDAKTKRPIRDASLALNHKGKPGTLFQPGGTTMDGEFNTLIPPSVPINVVVKAAGYKTWRYNNRGSAVRDAIRLRPGSSRKMIVELKQLG